MPHRLFFFRVRQVMMTRTLLCLTMFFALCGIGVAATLDGYTLTGIVHDPGRVSVAILEHEDGAFVVVREGESIELGKVTQIDRHSVILERPGELVSMSLEYGVERFGPDGAKRLRQAAAVGSGSPEQAAGGSSTVSTQFKPEAHVVAVRGSAEALSALIGGAAKGAGFSALNAAGNATTNTGQASGGGTTSGSGSSGGGGSGNTQNNAPQELGVALAEVFDLPPTMEIVQVNGTPVESAADSFAYIQAEIEFGNTVTLFTHGIPPSSRIYIHPDSPGS